MDLVKFKEQSIDSILLSFDFLLFLFLFSMNTVFEQLNITFKVKMNILIKTKLQPKFISKNLINIKTIHHQ